MITQAQHEQARRELGFPIGELDFRPECSHNFVKLISQSNDGKEVAKVLACIYCGQTRRATFKVH